MGGSVGAGFTHFKSKLCASGTNAGAGLYVGPVGAEIKIADKDSGVYRGASGAEYSVADKDLVVNWLAGSVSVGSVSFVVPYNVTISSVKHVRGDGTVAVFAASHGTVCLGSAGVIMTACAPVSSGVGDVVTTYATTSNTISAAAGSVIKMTLAAIGTACIQGVTAVFTRASN